MRKLYLILMCMVLFNFAGVSALSLAVHVPEKYADIMAGERFYFEIEVKYPENPNRKDLKLEYEVLTEDGNLVSQSKVLKAVETQASFIDFIVIPESTKSGLHIINVNVKDYEGLDEEVSSSFHIKSASGDKIMIYLMIILGAIVLVGALVVFGVVLRK